MKIAYIIPSLKNKGPIIVVKEIIEGLIELGVSKEDIIIYYFDEGSELDFPVKSKKIKFWESVYKDNHYDIIHSHMLRPDIYLLKEKIVNKILYKRIKPYIISTLHQRNFDNFYYETNNYIFSTFFSRLWEFILAFFDRIVVLSESMKNYYKKRIIHANKKIIVIHNGRTIIASNENKKKMQKEGILLGSACNLNKIKNLDKVIMAIKEMKNVQYFIIGDGPEKNILEKMAIDMKINEKVHFLGYKKNALEYFQLFDIFILPSKSEGMSLSLIEAAAMKKTIICSKIEPNLDMFDEKEAIFVEPEDIAGIQKAIKKAVDNKLFAEEAYKKYKEKYSGIAMAKKYYELYRNLLKLKNS